MDAEAGIQFSLKKKRHQSTGMMEHNFAAALVIILFSLSQRIGVAHCAQIPAVEVDALLEFKANYMSKGSQDVLRSWNESNTGSICESWLGVSCSASGVVRHIQGINLTNLGLAGILAPHLGNLSFLASLDLSKNYFAGSIPWQLQGCVSLKFLNLKINNLTGAIPSSISSLSSLRTLGLSINTLSGHIPPAILSNCTSLRKLSICQNSLTGPLPADLGLHLPNLEEVILWRNKISGPIPPSLGNCTSLIVLDLFGNQFSGPIPAELGMLQHLQLLYLWENNLTGTIPPSLGNCSSIIDLELTYNHLTGSIPSELGFLNQLALLFLNTNNLTGVIPPSLGNCSSIILLELDNNKLTSIPSELGFLNQVKRLFLAGNNLTGVIPPSLANCTNLLVLELFENQLTGSIPAELGQLRHLQKVLLDQNMLSGMIPQSLLSNCTDLLELALGVNQLIGSLSRLDFSNLRALQFLHLGDNRLTGEIPWSSLANCSSLFELALHGNLLHGGISSILGKLQRLKRLYLYFNLLQDEIPNFADYTDLTLEEVDLSYNRLNGSLPSGLSHALSTIAFALALSYNQLSGSLPLWLGQLQQAQEIDLSNNNFAGSIPESLGSCANLVSLDLSQNHLSGDLPLQLGNLTNLESLDLSNNNLSGLLPSYLGTNLHHLQLLNVSFNNLSGPIPKQGVFRNLNATCFQGNPGLCGPILHRQCTDLHRSKERGLHHHHHHSSLQLLRSWKGFLLLVACILLILLSIVSTFLLWRYCQRRTDKVTLNLFIGRLAGARRYSAKELMEVTQGYSEDNLLGQGGLSMVYKGVLNDGNIVAVKKIKDAYNIESSEALLREMRILSKLRHRNLVQVLGCVLNLDVKALVLEYMTNGSLEHYLNMHDQELHTNLVPEQIDPSYGLSYWEMLSRVAISIAQALTYLHHEYDVPIIHGDVKPSNILLDSDMEPHLADFGLAKLINRGAGAVSLTSDFKGSIGYMAPEYASTTQITTKVDVYGYGVVLLVMLTGRRPTQVLPMGLPLHEWVKSKLPSTDYNNIALLEEVLDISLLQRSNLNEASLFVRSLLRLGLACTMDHPNDRPTIQQVLGFLVSHKQGSLQISSNHLYCI